MYSEQIRCLSTKTDIRFHDFHNTLDTVCVSLQKQGVGVDVHHAAVISVEQEERMWDSVVLSLENLRHYCVECLLLLGCVLSQGWPRTPYFKVSRSSEDGEYSADTY